MPEGFQEGSDGLLGRSPNRSMKGPRSPSEGSCETAVVGPAFHRCLLKWLQKASKSSAIAALGSKKASKSPCDCCTGLTKSSPNAPCTPSNCQKYKTTQNHIIYKGSPLLYRVVLSCRSFWEHSMGCDGFEGRKGSLCRVVGGSGAARRTAPAFLKLSHSIKTIATPPKV